MKKRLATGAVLACLGMMAVPSTAEASCGFKIKIASGDKLQITKKDDCS